MANRRMFSLDIINTDKFLDMPASAQNLYFHLGMRADDDGFISNIKRIARITDCGKKDIDILVENGYLIVFEDGVSVIKHWKRNNYVRNDRYSPTVYAGHMEEIKEVNGSYELVDEKEEELTETAIDNNLTTPETDCQPVEKESASEKKSTGIKEKENSDTVGIPSDNQAVDKRYPQVRLGKDRLGKDNNTNDARAREEPVFRPPTQEEVIAYCKERASPIDPYRFFDYYSERNWKVKGNVIDWKACIEKWEHNGIDKRQQAHHKNERTGPRGNFEQREYSDELYDSLISNKGEGVRSG